MQVVIEKFPSESVEGYEEVLEDGVSDPESSAVISEKILLSGMSSTVTFVDLSNAICFACI